MGMVVRSNIMAQNANRQLGVNNSSVSKNLEKLSSGFKINRAGDDASGLAISEKMKAQIKGLETASANSQDGISLVQTAEGALTEVHDMLNRMTELATKSANGTIKDAVDREAIQKEVNDLNSEIDRISKSTNFNGINLLDGSMGGGASVTKIAKSATASGTAMKHGDITFSGGKDSVSIAFTALAATAADSAAWTGTVTGGNSTLTINLQKDKTYSAEDIQKLIDKATGEKGSDSLKIAIDGDGTIATDATGGTLGAGYTTKFEGYKAATGSLTAGTTTVLVSSNAGKLGNLTNAIAFQTATAADATAAWQTSGALNITLDSRKSTYTAAELNSLIQNATGEDGAIASGLNFKFEGAVLTSQLTGNITLANGAGAQGGGLTLQVGDTGDTFNMVTVSVDDMSSTGLSTKGLNVGNADSARASIQTIKDAINKVSTNRANMGALQNRLEHTINNLDVSAENMSAANSRIRDTDMAKQMMDYTKMNVLTQAAQAMLAQANQQPQSILQLLK